MNISIKPTELMTGNRDGSSNLFNVTQVSLRLSYGENGFRSTIIETLSS